MTQTLAQRREFIAMMAILTATVAFSVDAMMPALPEIAAELSPAATNRAGLVITSFFVGLGVGTIFAGPISDATARKPIIMWGLLLYFIGAVWAWLTQSLEMLLLARFVQGVGSAGPRVVALAMIRDLYSGREMARLISFVMMIFSLVPAVAPSIGAIIIALSGWRMIFVSFLIFATLLSLWVWQRRDETLAPSARRPISWPNLRAALIEMFANPQIRMAIAVQGVVFGVLFIALVNVQPMFDQIFNLRDQVPYWFGGIALVATTSSLLNARLVMRFGMRRMVRFSISMQVIISASIFVISESAFLTADQLFPLFLFWVASIFYMAGMTLGNLNALAMEPLPHVAGLAASVTNSLANIAGAILSIPVGLAFDATLRAPTLAIAVLCLSALGILAITRQASP
jgi:DHA1 family bicyclomycin/chloramphenicol resistance-like MFS transporter